MRDADSGFRTWSRIVLWGPQPTPIKSDFFEPFKLTTMVRPIRQPRAHVTGINNAWERIFTIVNSCPNWTFSSQQNFSCGHTDTYQISEWKGKAETHEYVLDDTCGRVWVTQPHLEPPEFYPDYRYDGFEGETLTDYRIPPLFDNPMARIHATASITSDRMLLIY